MVRFRRHLGARRRGSFTVHVRTKPKLNFPTVHSTYGPTCTKKEFRIGAASRGGRTHLARAASTAFGASPAANLKALWF